MPPLGVPPSPGCTVGGIHGQSSGPRRLIASGITPGFAILAFLLHLMVKYFIRYSTSWRDYLVSAALLLAIGRTIIFILCEYGRKFTFIQIAT